MLFFTHVFYKVFTHLFAKFSPMFFWQSFHPCFFLHPSFFTNAFFTHVFFSPMFFHSCCVYKPIKFLQTHFQSSSKFLSTHLTFLLVLVPTTQCSFGKINNVYNILYCIGRFIRSRLEKSRWPIAKNEQWFKKDILHAFILIHIAIFIIEHILTNFVPQHVYVYFTQRNYFHPIFYHNTFTFSSHAFSFLLHFASAFSVFL